MKAIEEILRNAGISPIAGVDEAGRGPCAGPLVIAAVVLREPQSSELSAVRDSKELSEAKRESLYQTISDVAENISVIVVPPHEIDLRGVHAANLDGMRRAVRALTVEPAYVLTDGYAIDGLGLPSIAVWKGDQVVTAISAASIIAKVTRDRIMVELDCQFPQYGFAQHKGYITSQHTKALQQYGPCREHRKSFSNIAALL